jgi:hypothetical protein
MSVLLFGLLCGIVMGKFIQPFTISTVLVTTVCALALIVKKKKFVAIGYLVIGVIWGAWHGEF